MTVDKIEAITMVAVLDRILDFCDRIMRSFNSILNLKGLFSSDKDIITLVTLLITTLAAYLSKFVVEEKEEKIEVDTKKVTPKGELKAKDLSPTSKLKGTITKVGEAFVEISYEGTKTLVEGIIPKVKKGQEVLESTVLGETTSTEVTIKKTERVSRIKEPTKIVGETTEISQEVLESTVTKLADEKFKSLQKSYSTAKAWSTKTDSKKYKEGCPSKGFAGRPADFDAKCLYAVETLMAKAGFNAYQACGVVGCLISESGLLPLAFNRSGGNYGAQGLAQWRGPRVEKYISIYGVMQCLDDNFSHQIDFIVYEFANTHKYAIPRSDSLYNATYDAFYKYEGAAGDPDAHLSNRVENAKYAYTLYLKRYESIMSSSSKTTKVFVESRKLKQ